MIDMIEVFLSILLGLAFFIFIALFLTRVARRDLDKTHTWCESCRLMVPDYAKHYHKVHSGDGKVV